MTFARIKTIARTGTVSLKETQDTDQTILLENEDGLHTEKTAPTTDLQLPIMTEIHQEKEIPQATDTNQDPTMIPEEMITNQDPTPTMDTETTGITLTIDPTTETVLTTEGTIPTIEEIVLTTEETTLTIKETTLTTGIIQGTIPSTEIQTTEILTTDPTQEMDTTKDQLLRTEHSFTLKRDHTPTQKPKK